MIEEGKTLSAKKLRQNAEKRLRLTRHDIANMPTPDIQELVHELQVHEVELQMQNEELRRTQGDLEAARDKYWDLFDFAPVGYLTLDTNGTILEANLMAAKQFAIPRQELIGKRFAHFVAPCCQDKFHLYNRRVLTSDEAQFCELELVRPKKPLLYIQMHSLRIADSPHHYRAAITDISELKALEKKLIASSSEAKAANKAKSQFLANMSHEIRTPMNAIIGLSHLLFRSQPLTSTQKEQLGVLQSSANSLMGLINELLDISKIEACGMEVERISFNFSHILKDVLGMLSVKATEKGLALIEDNHLTHEMFWGDALRLRQIVTNLLSNSIKFTHQGEVVLHIESSVEEDWANIVLSVSDTGIGIPSTKLETIFEAFTQADASMTRRYGGSGLGLAICKQLAEHMGGTINVTSLEGVGSTFTVQLPLQVSHEKPPMAEEMESESAAGLPLISCNRNQRILLVDDHAPNVLIAKTFLEYFSYECDTVSDGRQAVEYVKKNRYSLILMDVQMQDMDGFEATRQIRQIEKQLHSPSIPIIAMTAHALTGDREKCLQAGMTDYISKPFDPDELRSKLERYMPDEGSLNNRQKIASGI